MNKVEYAGGLVMDMLDKAYEMDMVPYYSTDIICYALGECTQCQIRHDKIFGIYICQNPDHMADDFSLMSAMCSAGVQNDVELFVLLGRLVATYMKKAKHLGEGPY